ncbi:UNKNOWN [Stylonychia lemnae]|uniref:Uncharacterized protein n=1 Tax=Stylonychia lemnae TaxID=5949 RepID=A0A077ZX55_STYLE|nr:UNKNOWN [Stylonychia lemnae]|eukprot:CDW73106.1 UNKNOWN [Stylonychia lemnae]
MIHSKKGSQMGGKIYVGLNDVDKRRDQIEGSGRLFKYNDQNIGQLKNFLNPKNDIYKLPKEKLARMHSLKLVDPPKLVKQIIDKNDQRMERREKLNQEKAENQKHMMIMKQRMISKMYLKGGQIGADVDPNDNDLDLIQNEKFQKSRRRKQRLEKIMQQINRDADLDQFKFQPDELKFPYSLHERRVTTQKLQEYDEQLPDVRDKYSNIKKNKKLLSNFIHKSSSQPSLILDNKNVRLTQTVGGTGTGGMTSRRQSIQIDPEQEFMEKQKALQKQNHQRLKALRQEVVYIRNNLHQESTEFNQLLGMIQSLKEFFPLNTLLQKERNFYREARKSIGSIEELRDYQKSQLVIIDKKQNYHTRQQSLDEKFGNKRQIQNLIKNNANQNFIEKYKIQNFQETGLSKDKYLTQLINIRELEKKQQLMEKNLYLNMNHNDLDDTSSDEDSHQITMITEGNLESVDRQGNEHHTPFNNKNMLQQTQPKLPLNKPKSHNNLQSIQKTLNYPNIQISSLGQPASPSHDKNHEFLDLDNLSFNSKELNSPLRRSPTRSPSKKKETKESKLLLSKFHDDPVIQSIITNGQVSSFLRVKKNQMKKEKNMLQLIPSLEYVDAQQSIKNASQTARNNQNPQLSEYRRASLNFEAVHEIQKNKTERQLLKKLQRHFKKINSELQPTISRSQLNKQLSIMEKINEEERHRITGSNVKLSQCMLNIVDGVHQQAAQQPISQLSQHQDASSSNKLTSSPSFKKPMNGVGGKNQQKHHENIDPLFSNEYFQRKYSNYEEEHLKKDSELRDIQHSSLNKFKDQISQVKTSLLTQIQMKEQLIKEFKDKTLDMLNNKMQKHQSNQQKKSIVKMTTMKKGNNVI